MRQLRVSDGSSRFAGVVLSWRALGRSPPPCVPPRRGGNFFLTEGAPVGDPQGAEPTGASPPSFPLSESGSGWRPLLSVVPQ